MIKVDCDYIQERIAQLRTKKGVSARDMSLSLGQSESYINTIENKKALPSMTMFLQICEYFNIEPRDFFVPENKNPEKLRKLIEDLKCLNDKTINHIAGLTEELVKR